MLLALMNKAREVGDHEIQPADTVVSMFRKQNAHRAKQNFQSRSANYSISIHFTEIFRSSCRFYRLFLFKLCTFKLLSEVYHPIVLPL